MAAKVFPHTASEMTSFSCMKWKVSHLMGAHACRLTQNTQSSSGSPVNSSEAAQAEAYEYNCGILSSGRKQNYQSFESRVSELRITVQCLHTGSTKNKDSYQDCMSGSNCLVCGSGQTANLSAIYWRQHLMRFNPVEQQQKKSVYFFLWKKLN